ncbi:MAG TPA: hypothetical protein VN033_04860 [Vulgatibacter sp.]|nr:hypothetical protein [Vulgatibacter sp.]
MGNQIEFTVGESDGSDALPLATGEIRRVALRKGGLMYDDKAEWPSRHAEKGNRPVVLFGGKIRATRRHVPIAPKTLEGALEGFAKLGAKKDPAASVLAFARNVGLLGLCQHLTPKLDCKRGCDHESPEPVEVWVDLSNAVADAITIAREVAEAPEAEVDDPALWERILRFTDAWHPDDGPPGEVDDAAREPRLYLAEFVNAWLHAAGVRPVLRWDDRPRMELQGAGLGGWLPSGRSVLFPALAVQLLGTLAEIKKTRRCAACNAEVNHHPTGRGEDVYCLDNDDCQRWARARWARNRRAKQKAKK